MNGEETASYTYQYDALGNIKSKPDTGHQSYTYGQGITTDNAGPHAIKTLDGRTFEYDASGNLKNDGERELRWKTFQKPSMLRKGTATIWLEYGAGNNRTRRRQGNFNTWYLDGGPDVQIERLTHNNNTDVTTKYHYMANGQVVAIDTATDTDTQSHYLHTDRLGSASVLTDSNRAMVEQMSYDIWGQVRNLNDGEVLVLKSQYHTKGYTGHEMLSDVDLVHMNGRVYDPILGRFMSADPFVQFAFNSQSYNRYSYVLNNPLGATDPSGYMSEEVDSGWSWGESRLNPKNWNIGGGTDPNIGNDSGLDGGSSSDLGIAEAKGIEKVYEFIYNATGYAPSDEVVNVAASIGDNLTADLTAEVREYLGVDNIDTNSPEFIAAATAMTIGTGPKGLAQAAAKKIAAAAKKKFTKAGGCSFDGSMEVLTDEGYVAIAELPIGKTTVLAIDELTGEYHLRPVLHHLWNAYGHTVYIDMQGTQSMVRQTIVSNQIHPFFVKRAGYVSPLLMPVGSHAEQHVYAGPIEDGHWIQAADLRVGDLLLSSDGDWVEVTGLRVTDTTTRYLIFISLD